MIGGVPASGTHAVLANRLIRHASSLLKSDSASSSSPSSTGNLLVDRLLAAQESLGLPGAEPLRQPGGDSSNSGSQSAGLSTSQMQSAATQPNQSSVTQEDLQVAALAFIDHRRKSGPRDWRLFARRFIGKERFGARNAVPKQQLLRALSDVCRVKLGPRKGAGRRKARASASGKLGKGRSSGFGGVIGGPGPPGVA